MTLSFKIFLSCLSGVLVFTSFPKFNLFFPIFFSLIPFLYAVSKSENIKESAILGFVFGFSLNLGAFYWLIKTIVNFSNLGYIYSFLIFIFYALYNSIFCVICAILTYVLLKRFSFFVFFPFLYSSIEFIFPTVFPWNFGAILYRTPILIQFIDITGAYGASYFVILINCFVYEIIFSRKKIIAHSFVVVLLACFVFGYGYSKLNEKPEILRENRISIIQPNINIFDKVASENNFGMAMNVYNKHLELTKQALNYNPDLVIWPETNFPFVFSENSSYVDMLINDIKKLNVNLLVGAISEDQNQANYNSAYIISREGQILGRYDKINLLILGEYIPFSKIFPKIKELIQGSSNLERGNKRQMLNMPWERLAIPICYEIIKPKLIRKLLGETGNLIINITNDAWFNDTSGPYLHFMLSVLRSIELRVPIIRVANSGVSAFIDSNGVIVKKSDIFKEDILNHVVKIQARYSFYKKYGDVFGVITFVLVFIFLLTSIKQTKRSN
jgi:apolipoprotein N-acyltransferase